MLFFLEPYSHVARLLNEWKWLLHFSFFARGQTDRQTVVVYNYLKCPSFWSPSVCSATATDPCLFSSTNVPLVVVSLYSTINLTVSPLLYSTNNVPVILVPSVYSIMDMALVLNPLSLTVAVPSLCRTTNVHIILFLLSIWSGWEIVVDYIPSALCNAGSPWPKSQAFCDGYCDKLCIYHQELLSWSFELCMMCLLICARLFVNTRWLHLQIQVFSSVYCALQSSVTDSIATYYLRVSHCITGTWLAPTDPHSKLGRGMVTCWKSCTWNRGCASNPGPHFCV